MLLSSLGDIDPLGSWFPEGNHAADKHEGLMEAFNTLIENIYKRKVERNCLSMD